MEHPPEHHHHRSLSPSAIMDGLFSTSAAGPSATAPSKQSEFRASSPSHQSSGESGAWTLPSILKQGRSGLSNVSVEQLQHCLQPVLAGLEQLDPETLLQLDRVQSGGARLRDGYVLQARDDGPVLIGDVYFGVPEKSVSHARTFWFSSLQCASTSHS